MRRRPHRKCVRAFQARTLPPPRTERCFVSELANPWTYAGSAFSARRAQGDFIYGSPASFFELHLVAVSNFSGEGSDLQYPLYRCSLPRRVAGSSHWTEFPGRLVRLAHTGRYTTAPSTRGERRKQCGSYNCGFDALGHLLSPAVKTGSKLTPAGPVPVMPFFAETVWPGQRRVMTKKAPRPVGVRHANFHLPP